MALKQWLKTYETVTNDMKMGWNCDSNKDNCKYNMYNSAMYLSGHDLMLSRGNEWFWNLD